MVGEFPELQGVMGRYYALHDGEDPRVADAIADHYKPLGPNDTCPTAPDSIVVALADKLDTLAAFFAIDEKPTGSRDPFALRRAALGIIRIILENRLRLPLKAVFAEAHLALRAQQRADEIGIPGSGVGVDPETPPDLLPFIADRLKVHLREAGRAPRSDRRGLRADRGRRSRPSAGPRRCACEFPRHRGRRESADRLSPRREHRRDRGAQGRAGPTARSTPICCAWTRSATSPRGLDETESRAAATLEREDFGQAMAALASLRRPVDEFFDKVTVNADDRALRENRLRLLSRIRAVMNQVADFSQIEG